MLWMSNPVDVVAVGCCQAFEGILSDLGSSFFGGRLGLGLRLELGSGLGVGVEG